MIVPSANFEFILFYHVHRSCAHSAIHHFFYIHYCSLSTFHNTKLGSHQHTALPPCFGEVISEERMASHLVEFLLVVFYKVRIMRLYSISVGGDMTCSSPTSSKLQPYKKLIQWDALISAKTPILNKMSTLERTTMHPRCRPKE